VSSGAWRHQSRQQFALPLHIRRARDTVRAEPNWALNEPLVEGWQAVEAEREQYRMLFELAPAAYLLTDPAAVIQGPTGGRSACWGAARPFLSAPQAERHLAGPDRPGQPARLAGEAALDPAEEPPAL
jgi:hypothetical protein